MKTVCPECLKVFTIPDFPQTASQLICPQCGATFDVEANLSFEEHFGSPNAEEPVGLTSASAD